MNNQPIDSAALAGAILAGALAVFIEPGPFDVLNVVIGITLLTILYAYELNRPRTDAQSVAFGAVCAFCILLVVGFLAELWLPLSSFPIAVSGKGEPESRVPDWFLAAAWLIFTVLFFLIGRTVARKLRLKIQEDSRTQGSVTADNSPNPPH